ncbi:hypothetical protein ADUPG1_011910, partial [Aduncisulcus paluster]
IDVEKSVVVASLSLQNEASSDDNEDINTQSVQHSPSSEEVEDSTRPSQHESPRNQHGKQYLSVQSPVSAQSFSYLGTDTVPHTTSFPVQVIGKLKWTDEQREIEEKVRKTMEDEMKRKEDDGGAKKKGGKKPGKKGEDESETISPVFFPSFVHSCKVSDKEIDMQQQEEEGEEEGEEEEEKTVVSKPGVSSKKGDKKTSNKDETVNDEQDNHSLPYSGTPFVQVFNWERTMMFHVLPSFLSREEIVAFLREIGSKKREIEAESASGILHKESARKDKNKDDDSVAISEKEESRKMLFGLEEEQFLAISGPYEASDKFVTNICIKKILFSMFCCSCSPSSCDDTVEQSSLPFNSSDSNILTRLLLCLIVDSDVKTVIDKLYGTLSPLSSQSLDSSLSEALYNGFSSLLLLSTQQMEGSEFKKEQTLIREMQEEIDGGKKDKGKDKKGKEKGGANVELELPPKPEVTGVFQSIDSVIGMFSKFSKHLIGLSEALYNGFSSLLLLSTQQMEGSEFKKEQTLIREMQEEIDGGKKDKGKDKKGKEKGGANVELELPPKPEVTGVFQSIDSVIGMFSKFSKHLIGFETLDEVEREKKELEKLREETQQSKGKDKKKGKDTPDEETDSYRIMCDMSGYMTMVLSEDSP